MPLINPNLKHLVKCFKDDTVSGVGLEGSSRSGKTWSSIDFQVWLCSKVETNATINIYKETYNSFKTTLYEDYNRRLPMFGISSPFADKQEVRSFKLFGNTINLLGADSDTVLHGVGSDYNYYNEMLDIPKSVFDQSEMRCRKFWWGDWNPKTTKHYVFENILKRPDVGYLKTTFRDNPFISPKEKAKILSYEPTPENIKNGTADEYMWNVYGLGIRSAPDGVVFQHVTWIKEFPKGLEKIYYGLDFGYTNSPTALVKVGVKGKRMYIQKLLYSPIDNPDTLLLLLKKLVPEGAEIWCDSADPGQIGYLRQKGLKTLAVNKFQGSIKYGISLMKRYELCIVEDMDFMNEQANYQFKVVHGIKLDEPEDEDNHLWDASRYVAISRLRLE